MPENSLGWVSYPPPILGIGGVSRARHRKRREKEWGLSLAAGREWVQHTWVRALARSELLAALNLLRIGWVQGRLSVLDWAWLLPWGEWMLEGLSVVWPWLGRQPEMRVLRWAVERLRWASLLVCGAQMSAHWRTLNERPGFEQGMLAGIGFLSEEIVWQTESEGDEVPSLWIAVKRVLDGWQVWIGDQFYLPVQEENVFQQRQAILLLRRLESAQPRCGSRATRDGRRPLLAQQALARVFEVTQPEISRWERYEQEQDWANLLSLHSSEVLTAEVRRQIIDLCAQFPWWTRKCIYAHLRQNGLPVTYQQVR
jgi:hypothetical protein